MWFITIKHCYYLQKKINVLLHFYALEKYHLNQNMCTPLTITNCISYTHRHITPIPINHLAGTQIIGCTKKNVHSASCQGATRIRVFACVSKCVCACVFGGAHNRQSQPVLADSRQHYTVNCIRVTVVVVVVCALGVMCTLHIC